MKALCKTKSKVIIIIIIMYYAYSWYANMPKTDWEHNVMYLIESSHKMLESTSFSICHVECLSDILGFKA